MSNNNMDNNEIVRTGILFKKGSGGGLLGRKNWKTRYIVLSKNFLSYYTHQLGELKGKIDLRHCKQDKIEVMPLDALKTGTSYSSIWRIAINTPERRLLLAAASESEMNDWIYDLRSICATTA